MLFNWIDHPSFRRDEQLMAILYELGIATKKQLSTITGWTENQIAYSIDRIRKWEKDKEKRDEWIFCYRLPLQKNRIGAFTLGKKGLRYVADMMQESRPRRRESPKGQISHFLGLNDILCRVLESGTPRETLSWLSTLKSIDFLDHLYQSKGLEFTGSIRPDARLIAGKRSFWLEYDNSTEGPRQIERKYHEYTLTLIHPEKGKMDHAPVVWVTTSESRRSYLERLWIATRERFTEYPEMHFFVEGQETEFLLPKDCFLTV